MRKIYLFGLLLLSIIVANAQTDEEILEIQTHTNTKQLLIDGQVHAQQFNTIKNRALYLAKYNGWQIVIENDSVYSELVGVTEEDKPIYYSTSNVAAAKSTRTNHLNTGGSLGLNLMGLNLRAHVWDAGLARATHQEYDGAGGANRFITGDASTSLHFHAAHVTGTIMASGVVANAKGMAPYSRVSGYDWNSDLSEATIAAANGMLISNHSYGLNPSWVESSNPTWFGAYIQQSRDWDTIMRNAPFYLMVVAAGNDGNNNRPNPLLLGYDKLTGHATSKNNLVVANAQDASIASNGNLISVSINSSSSQGPTDDLRIKPDITGNGTGVYSTYESSDTAYASISGTSMASPNVTGSLLLLQEHYRNRNSNFMRAATLKGLALHTADDAGPTGPDAIWGWGLLNAKKAAETITQRGVSSIIDELTISQGQTITINVNSDGISPLVASISWTDLPGVVSTTLNNNSPRLINDLDMRITQGATTTFPWRLTASNLNGLGDNNRDPFERINVNNANGSYTITITHKGTISGASQNFSLIVTGLSSCPNALNITTNVTSGSDTKQASSTINASNTINTATIAIYHAGDEVLLSNGFTSNNGSVFRAYIEGCTNIYVARQANPSTQQEYDYEAQNMETETLKEQLKIAPNPNNGVFNLLFETVTDGEIEIIDLYGVTIYKSSFINQKEFAITIQNSPKGIYILKVRTNSGIDAIEKIVKE